MKAKLVAYTQATENFIGLDDVEDIVAYCARVSNPSNQMNQETNDRLIAYLIKHKHWSPFEMASITIEVETTRDIARQLLRHRSFSFQEFSQRYANVNEFDRSFVIREARLQDEKNRQNSIEFDDNAIKAAWIAHQNAVIERAKLAYNWAIENGIAKEQARAVLPEGNTVSKLYVNGTIRSWIHYLDLRMGNGTQKEHIELATAIAEAIVEVFPVKNYLDKSE